MPFNYKIKNQTIFFSNFLNLLCVKILFRMFKTISSCYEVNWPVPLSLGRWAVVSVQSAPSRPHVTLHNLCKPVWHIYLKHHINKLLIDRTSSINKKVINYTCAHRYGHSCKHNTFVYVYIILKTIMAL